MLRRKLVIINLVFAFVMLVILVAGVFLLMHSIDKSARYEMEVDELQTVETTLSNLTFPELIKFKADAPRPADYHMPEGYQLVVFDEFGNLWYNEGFPKDVIEALKRRAPVAPNDVTATMYGGVVIVSTTLDGFSVHAVNAEGSILGELRRIVLLYTLVSMVALLIIFVGSIVVEMQVIFPRLSKLREAMDQVYNGNYEQTLKLRPGAKRDEVTALLVDFDMLRRKLRDATLAKEAADRERGIVVSGISHDLRTPLTVIKTHAKGLLDGVAKRVGKEDEYISNIYSTALDMETLVAKLADFTKVETHEITYSFVVRDIGEHIQAFVDKHYIAYAARGLNLKCKVPKGKKLWVNIDKDQFNRVWQNLCDNSLKYKEKETANVLISAELIENNVVVRVADDGPGIAEYEVEYIFESYYRGDASRTNPTDGSGLGLAIVKNCVTAHNGQIQAYNDKGLTIEIILPYRRKK